MYHFIRRCFVFVLVLAFGFSFLLCTLLRTGWSQSDSTYTRQCYGLYCYDPFASPYGPGVGLYGDYGGELGGEGALYGAQDGSYGGYGGTVARVFGTDFLESFLYPFRGGIRTYPEMLYQSPESRAILLGNLVHNRIIGPFSLSGSTSSVMDQSGGALGATIERYIPNVKSQSSMLFGVTGLMGRSISGTYYLNPAESLPYVQTTWQGSLISVSDILY